jgi:hypothetical protein
MCEIVMVAGLKQLRRESEIEDGNSQPPPHEWIKKTRLTEPESESEIQKLELKRQDENILRNYHVQLSRNVPMVKTPFKTTRVKLKPEIVEALSSWPRQLQLNDKKDFGDVGDLGGDCDKFGYGTNALVTFPLMCMVLGDFFDSYSPKTPGLNFKCYALSLLNSAEYNTMDTTRFWQADDIKNWIRNVVACDSGFFLGSHAEIEEDPQIFRRCLIFRIRSKIVDQGIFGHMFVLMIQKVGNGPIEFVILDSVPSHMYSDGIHQQIKEAAEDGICNVAHEYGHYSPNFTVTLFCSANCMQSSRPFMVCISRALRSCMYLSLVRDYNNIKESPDGFQHHAEIFRQQLHRMINWIHNNRRVLSQDKVPIVSLNMTKPLFQLNSENCYLVLASPTPIPEDVKIWQRATIDYIYRYCEPLSYHFSKDGKRAFIRSESEGAHMCTVSSRFGL